MSPIFLTQLSNVSPNTYSVNISSTRFLLFSISFCLVIFCFFLRPRFFLGEKEEFDDSSSRSQLSKFTSLKSSEAICVIFSAHYFGSLASIKKPVQPFSIDSSGPPELQAITTQPRYIASTGTMPKCSFSGVQRSISVF